MAHSKINIGQVSKLANLPLTIEEKSLYESQLTSILEFVEQIESVDTKDIDHTFNVTPNKNITRKDIVNKSITQDEATTNAAVKKNGFIVSKGVFENE